MSMSSGRRKPEVKRALMTSELKRRFLSLPPQIKRVMDMHLITLLERYVGSRRMMKRYAFLKLQVFQDAPETNRAAFLKLITTSNHRNFELTLRCFRRWGGLLARRKAARSIAARAFGTARRVLLRGAFVPWARHELIIARARRCCQRMALEATGVARGWRTWRRRHMRHKPAGAALLEAAHVFEDSLPPRAARVQRLRLHGRRSAACGEAWRKWRAVVGVERRRGVAQRAVAARGARLLGVARRVGGEPRALRRAWARWVAVAWSALTRGTWEASAAAVVAAAAVRIVRERHVGSWGVELELEPAAPRAREGAPPPPPPPPPQEQLLSQEQLLLRELAALIDNPPTGGASGGGGTAAAQEGDAASSAWASWGDQVEECLRRLRRGSGAASGGGGGGSAGGALLLPLEEVRAALAAADAVAATAEREKAVRRERKRGRKKMEQLVEARAAGVRAAEAVRAKAALSAERQRRAGGAGTKGALSAKAASAATAVGSALAGSGAEGHGARRGGAQGGADDDDDDDADDADDADEPPPPPSPAVSFAQRSRGAVLAAAGAAAAAVRDAGGSVSQQVEAAAEAAAHAARHAWDSDAAAGEALRGGDVMAAAAVHSELAAVLPGRSVAVLAGCASGAAAGTAAATGALSAGATRLEAALCLGRATARTLVRDELLAEELRADEEQAGAGGHGGGMAGLCGGAALLAWHGEREGLGAACRSFCAAAAVAEATLVQLPPSPLSATATAKHGGSTLSPSPSPSHGAPSTPHAFARIVGGAPSLSSPSSAVEATAAGFSSREHALSVSRGPQHTAARVCGAVLLQANVEAGAAKSAVAEGGDAVVASAEDVLVASAATAALFLAARRAQDCAAAEEHALEQQALEKKARSRAAAAKLATMVGGSASRDGTGLLDDNDDDDDSYSVDSFDSEKDGSESSEAEEESGEEKEQQQQEEEEDCFGGLLPYILRLRAPQSRRSGGGGSARQLGLELSSVHTVAPSELGSAALNMAALVNSTVVSSAATCMLTAAACAAARLLPRAQAQAVGRAVELAARSEQTRNAVVVTRATVDAEKAIAKQVGAAAAALQASLWLHAAFVPASQGCVHCRAFVLTLLSAPLSLCAGPRSRSRSEAPLQRRSNSSRRPKSCACAAP
jgi:hypothetical protein